MRQGPALLGSVHASLAWLSWAYSWCSRCVIDSRSSRPLPSLRTYGSLSSAPRLQLYGARGCRCGSHCPGVPRHAAPRHGRSLAQAEGFVVKTTDRWRLRTAAH
jgi:hypothetical protein